MGRGQTNIQRTSRLYDRIGPVGRFDENKNGVLQQNKKSFEVFISWVAVYLGCCKLGRCPKGKGGGGKLLSKFQLPSSYGLGVMVF